MSTEGDFAHERTPSPRELRAKKREEAREEIDRIIREAKSQVNTATPRSDQVLNQVKDSADDGFNLEFEESFREQFNKKSDLSPSTFNSLGLLGGIKSFLGFEGHKSQEHSVIKNVGLLEQNNVKISKSVKDKMSHKDDTKDIAIENVKTIESGNFLENPFDELGLSEEQLRIVNDEMKRRTHEAHRTGFHEGAVKQREVSKYYYGTRINTNEAAGGTQSSTAAGSSKVIRDNNEYSKKVVSYENKAKNEYYNDKDENRDRDDSNDDDDYSDNDEDEELKFLKSTNGKIHQISVTGANFNIPIPRYDPRRQTANTYLSEIEAFFTVQHFRKDQFLSMVRTIMSKEVKAWFDNVKSNIRNWKEFKELFNLKYDTQNERVLRQQILTNRKQKPNESFESFVWEMVSLSKQVYKDEPLCDIVRRCRDGLHNDVRMLVGYSDAWTPQDLIDDIKRVVSDLKQRERVTGISFQLPPISIGHKQDVPFSRNSLNFYRRGRNSQFRRFNNRFTGHQRGHFNHSRGNNGNNANQFQSNEHNNGNNNLLQLTDGNNRGNHRGNRGSFRFNNNRFRGFGRFNNQERTINFQNPNFNVNNQNSPTCYNCNEIGHIARNCRNPNRNQNQLAYNNSNTNHFNSRTGINQIGNFHTNQQLNSNTNIPNQSNRPSFLLNPNEPRSNVPTHNLNL